MDINQAYLKFVNLLWDNIVKAYGSCFKVKVEMIDYEYMIEVLGTVFPNIQKISCDEVVQIGLNIRNMLVTHIMLEDSAYARYYQWMETMKLIDKNLNKVI